MRYVHQPPASRCLDPLTAVKFNLGWKLALAAKGIASSELLPSFEVERMPVIADMLKLTTGLSNRAFSTTTQQKIAAAKAAEAEAVALDERERGWFRGRKLFQLDLNYRWSSVVVDERFEALETERDAYGMPGCDVRAGDRAPDAPELVLLPPTGRSQTTRLFDIFSPAFHTILLFRSRDTESVHFAVDALRPLPRELFKVLLIVGSGATVGDDLDDIDLVVEDHKGYAREGYGLKDSDAPAVVLTRPDGMIGAFTISAGGVQKYLSGVFAFP